MDDIVLLSDDVVDNTDSVITETTTTESEPVDVVDDSFNSTNEFTTVIVDNSFVEWLESRDLFNTNINDFTITEILLSLILFVMLIKTFILRR